MRKHNNNPDRPYSRAQAAEYLGVARRTLVDWEEAGLLLPSFKTFGNHARYYKADLDAAKQKTGN